ncbi:hypothetical protein ACLOJK_022487 [Asimina triloba]
MAPKVGFSFVSNGSSVLGRRRWRCVSSMAVGRQWIDAEFGWIFRGNGFWSGLVTVMGSIDGEVALVGSREEAEAAAISFDLGGRLIKIRCSFVMKELFSFTVRSYGNSLRLHDVAKTSCNQFLLGKNSASSPLSYWISSAAPCEPLRSPASDLQPDLSLVGRSFVNSSPTSRALLDFFRRLPKRHNLNWSSSTSSAVAGLGRVAAMTNLEWQPSDCTVSQSMEGFLRTCSAVYLLFKS